MLFRSNVEERVWDNATQNYTSTNSNTNTNTCQILKAGSVIAETTNCWSQSSNFSLAWVDLFTSGVKKVQIAGSSGWDNANICVLKTDNTVACSKVLPGTRGTSTGNNTQEFDCDFDGIYEGTQWCQRGPADPPKFRIRNNNNKTGLKQKPKLCESMKTKKGLSSKPKPAKPKAKKIDPEQERREKVEKICELYSTENATIESCCSEIGISVRTFQNWINNNSELSDKYKKAKEANAKIGKDGIREKAATALERAITVFFVEEEETIERFNAEIGRAHV